MSTLAGLECPECGERFNADEVQSVCESCDSPLLARYDLQSAAQALDSAKVRARPAGLWHWAELPPVRNPQHRTTLGEGDTPLLLQRGWVPPDERIVLFNSGSRLKYLS